jgi:hypothetical protein
VDVLDSADRDPLLLDMAAQIWAEATTIRNGHDTTPGLDVSRPVIQGVLDRSPRAFLLIARSADGTAAGFAAIEPVAESSETVAQVSYIGVRPNCVAQVSYIGVRPNCGAKASAKRRSWRHSDGLRQPGTPALNCPFTRTTGKPSPSTSAWDGGPSAGQHRIPGPANRNNAMSCACSSHARASVK